MAYAKVNWVNGTTPENAATLGQMDQGIADAHAGLPPPPAGQEGKWLTVSGGAMVWAAAPAGGADLSYDGDWAAPTTYQDGDVVVYNGVAYLCVGGPTTTAPDPTLWGAASLVTIPTVTTLPSPAAHGQEVVLVDSATNPTYSWRLRYNAFASSAYKWEFMGGADGYAEAVGTVTTTSGTPADLGGPAFTPPRNGDYLVSFGARNDQGGAVTSPIVTLCQGATGLGRSADFLVWVSGTISSAVAGVSSTVRLAALVAASGALGLRYSSSNGTNVASFSQRWIRVQPVRVS